MGPDGSEAYPSGNGDMVMLVERDQGSVNVSATIGYEAVPNDP